MESTLLANSRVDTVFRPHTNEEDEKEEFKCAAEPMVLDCPQLHFRPINANKDGGGDFLGSIANSIVIFLLKFFFKLYW